MENNRGAECREMQRRTLAYRRQHGLGKPGIVRRAAAGPRINDSRLAYDGAVPREAQANGDLIVVVRRTPAGSDPCRNAMNARNHRRQRVSGRRLRPERERDDPD